MTEHVVYGAYCLVYKPQGHKWIEMRPGWAMVQLLRDSSDYTYRLIGWIDSDQDTEVVVNSNVTSGSRYKKITKDFHRFFDELGSVYGFGFHDPKHADELMGHVVAAIAEWKRYEHVVNPDSNPTAIVIEAPSEDEFKASEQETARQDRRLTMGARDPPTVHTLGNHAPPDPSLLHKIGSLPQYPPKMARIIQSQHPENTISDPTKVARIVHTKWNAETNKFEGLPEEWEYMLNVQQFGLPLFLCERIKVEPYPERIPKVLEDLKTQFYELQGLEEPGIFRVPPDTHVKNKLREQLQERKEVTIRDVKAVASLIKEFFAQMPIKLFDGMDIQLFMDCTTGEEATAVVCQLHEPYQSLCWWLIDLLLEVANYHEYNKMTEKNLARVISPNLFTPAEGIEDIQLKFRALEKFISFFELAIRDRASMPYS